MNKNFNIKNTFKLHWLNPFNFKVLIFFIIFLFPVQSFATSADLFGFSSKPAAMGDAYVAGTRGGESLYYNPGGLALGKKFSFFAGTTMQQAWLNTPDGSTGIKDPFYFHMGLTITVPFKGFLKDKVRIGMALIAPSEQVAYLRLHLPTEVFYPYYENRSQRLVVLPGISFLMFDNPSYGKLGIGFAINYFAGLNGAIIGWEGASRAIEARVFEELEGRAGLNVGLSWEIGNFLIGFSYRQAFGVDFKNVSFNHVAGTDINMELSALTLYSPHTLSWGVAYKNPGFSIEFNLIESLWSLYDSPFVDMKSVLPLVGRLISDLPESEFNNTLAFKLGISKKITKSFALMGGLGFEQALISNQTGKTNILDGNKLTFSSGISWKITSQISLHGFLRYQMLIGETFTKNLNNNYDECAGQIPVAGASLVDEVNCVNGDPSTTGFQTTNPGYPKISSGGGVLSGGITLEVKP
jgi:Outer membrane protein transport protein (OMPP1/FadL/TodX)